MMINSHRLKVSKVVFTGAASSIMGQFPTKEKDFIFKDSTEWADPK